MFAEKKVLTGRRRWEREGGGGEGGQGRKEAEGTPEKEAEECQNAGELVGMAGPSGQVSREQSPLCLRPESRRQRP